MIYSYRIPKFGDCTIASLEVNWTESGYDIASECAEDFHTHHDGWDCSWPIEFVILREDGSEVGRYTVERESEPVFYAYEVKEKE